MHSSAWPVRISRFFFIACTAYAHVRPTDNINTPVAQLYDNGFREVLICIEFDHATNVARAIAEGGQRLGAYVYQRDQVVRNEVAPFWVGCLIAEEGKDYTRAHDARRAASTVCRPRQPLPQPCLEKPDSM